MKRKFKIKTRFISISCVLLAVLVFQWFQYSKEGEERFHQQERIELNMPEILFSDSFAAQSPIVEKDSFVKPEEAVPVFGFSEIEAMEAGSVLDSSKIEAEMEDRLFYSQEVSEEVSERISGISYQENETISLEELRYVRVLHYGFDGRVHIGELLVNQSIANDILEIMSELYKNKYPIERMVLVDEYGGDDEQSMSDNNTSAFNYRQIAGSNRLSNHSMGIAIDINPRYNPYVKTYDDGQMRISPANATDYADRTQDFPYKIDENDLCYRLFTEHGFTWGGSWNSVKDYQHFEK